MGREITLEEIKAAQETLRVKGIPIDSRRVAVHSSSLDPLFDELGLTQAARVVAMANVEYDQATDVYIFGSTDA